MVHIIYLDGNDPTCVNPPDSACSWRLSFLSAELSQTVTGWENESFPVRLYKGSCLFAVGGLSWDASMNTPPSETTLVLTVTDSGGNVVVAASTSSTGSAELAGFWSPCIATTTTTMSSRTTSISTTPSSTTVATSYSTSQTATTIHSSTTTGTSTSTTTASTTSYSNYTFEFVFHQGNETFCSTNNCYWAALITYTGVYDGQHGSFGLNTGGYGNETDQLTVAGCSTVQIQLKILSNNTNPYSTLTLMVLSDSGQVLFSTTDTITFVDYYSSWTAPC